MLPERLCAQDLSISSKSNATAVKRLLSAFRSVSALSATTESLASKMSDCSSNLLSKILSFVAILELILTSSVLVLVSTYVSLLSKASACAVI